MIDDVAPDIRSLGVAVDEHDRVALSCLHVVDLVPLYSDKL